MHCTNMVVQESKRWDSVVIGTGDGRSSTVIQLNNVQNTELEHLGSKKDAVLMSGI